MLLSIWIVNIPNIGWEMIHVNGFAYPSNLCKLIIKFILEYGFTQSVNVATRENNIFHQQTFLDKTCCTVPGISDYEAVLIESFITLTLQHPKPRKITLWNKTDIAQFSDEFFNKFSTTVPIDTLWEEFKSLCSGCISSIPTKPIHTSNNQPWISSFIRQLSRKKQCLYNNDLTVHVNGKITKTLKSSSTKMSRSPLQVHNITY